MRLSQYLSGLSGATSPLQIINPPQLTPYKYVAPVYFGPNSAGYYWYYDAAAMGIPGEVRNVTTLPVDDSGIPWDVPDPKQIVAYFDQGGGRWIAEYYAVYQDRLYKVATVSGQDKSMLQAVLTEGLPFIASVASLVASGGASLFDIGKTAVSTIISQSSQQAQQAQASAPTQIAAQVEQQAQALADAQAAADALKLQQAQAAADALKLQQAQAAADHAKALQDLATAQAAADAAAQAAQTAQTPHEAQAAQVAQQAAHTAAATAFTQASQAEASHQAATTGLANLSSLLYDSTVTVAGFSMKPATLALLTLAGVLLLE